MDLTNSERSGLFLKEFHEKRDGMWGFCASMWTLIFMRVWM